MDGAEWEKVGVGSERNMLGLGDKDKDKKDLFTEVDHSFSATTILPVYPWDSSFLPEDSHGPTHHISQSSKTS